MEQSVTRVSGKGKIARVLLVALLSLVGLTVVGVGQAAAAAPVVKSLTPATGTADGGTSVTIAGSGFTGATSVTFGGVAATFTVNTGLKITATAPAAVANSAAVVPVVVTVGGVQSTPAAAGDNDYTYTWPSAPTVTGIGLIPATSSQTGTTVTVTAAGTWTTGQQVSISGFTNGLPSGIYSLLSGGSGTFTITNVGSNGGPGSGLVSATPAGAIGPPAGGTVVILSGNHFAGASAVDFGSTPATSFTVNSTTQITATAPAGSVGGVNVTVTTPNSTSVASGNTDGFSYVGPPVVTGLTTVSTTPGGPTGGGTQVTIAGTGFSDVTAVDFGSTAASSYLVNGLNSITAVSPPGTGTADVTVTASGVTSTTSAADIFTYNGTLTVANGNASYSNSPGTSVPVTATSQSGTTVTITAIGTWTTGEKVSLSGFTNGLTSGAYTILAGNTGSFTVTFSTGTTTGSGTGTVLVPATASATAVTKTSQSGNTVTLTAIGSWFAGQKVYLTGFTNGLTTGDYTVLEGTSGSFLISFAPALSASGTGTAVAYQAQSFNAATLVTGGGTINPSSVTVTVPPASGSLTAVGSQLIYIPVQTTPTSYTVGTTTTWNRTTTTTGVQTATFQICQTAPSASCATGTMTYTPSSTGFYVGNQLKALGQSVTVVEDTGAGIVVPATAASGSTFTSVTAPTEADLPSTSSGFNVQGIGGYQSITPVPAGLSLVPGTLSVSGGDSLTSGKYTATLCTAAIGYVAGTCTANNAGNFQTSYPYIETSLNVGTQVPGGSQLSLPTVSATWEVTASSGTASSYETEFVVATTVLTVGTLALDAYPTDLASYLSQGSGAPVPTYVAPSPRWTVNITGGAPTAPGAPTGVSAVAGNASAVVSWTPPASDGGSAITHYTATSSPGGLTCSAASSPCTVSGLTNGTPYTFTVTATNAIGTGAASTASSAVTPEAPETAPGAPTGVSAVAGNASAVVSWTAPASDGGSAITGYTVTSSPGNITCTAASSPCTVSGLTNGTPYTFTVTATNAIGTSPPSTPSASVTPVAGVPGAPTGVSAVAGNASAVVSWTAPANDGGSPITNYTATSSPGGLTCSGPSSPCTVSGLTNGTPYTFTVTATNSTGTGSASSPSAQVTPATVPGAPTGVSAVAGNGSAAVSWTAPASNGGSTITGYTVTSSPGGFTCSSASSPCTVSGLTNGTSYTFTVKATNAKGSGTASAPSSAVTPVAVLPGAPNGVTATAGNQSAEVSWTPGATGGSPILSYTVSSTPSSAGCTVSGSTRHCTVSGLTNGTRYTFQVSATNVIGTGPLSAPSSPVTPTSNGPIAGYWLATSGGAVLTNGAAVNYGSPAGLVLNSPIVALTPSPDRKGYWLVASDGGVFSYGDAGFYGSTGAEHLNKPIVGIAATSDGKGYWLVASDGGVFAYGDARFQGSLGATHLNAPIVGIAGNGTGGYWLVAADGGVFAYGSAAFHGSAGAEHLASPVVGIAATADGSGYYLVAADGGVFAYDAPFYGSAHGIAVGTVKGIALGAGGGYTIATTTGATYSYGTPSHGNQTNSGVTSPIISIGS